MADCPSKSVDTCLMQWMRCPHHTPTGPTHQPSLSHKATTSPSTPSHFSHTHTPGRERRERRERRGEREEEERRKKEKRDGAHTLLEHAGDELHHVLVPPELEEEALKPSSSSSRSWSKSGIDLLHQDLPVRAAVDGGSPRHGETPHNIHLHVPHPSPPPHELHGLQWRISPLMSSTFPQHMHGTSSTLRSFPTSLESHRNKPHSIRNPDAPGIIFDIFTPELSMVLPDYPSFSRTVCRHGVHPSGMFCAHRFSRPAAPAEGSVSSQQHSPNL